MEKLWRVTLALVEALLLDEPAPRALRGWASNLAVLGERTVLRNHVGLWVGWYTALPPAPATLAMLDAVRSDLSPEGGEGWRSKARRSARALGNAFVPRSEHDRSRD